MSGIFTIPTSILVTSQKPDLCIVNEETKEITLIELTIPFECNINAAHNRKTSRYELLVNDLKKSGYEVIYHPIEIGSRGLITKDNAYSLKTLFNIESDRSKELKDIQKNLTKISVIASYCIFYSKFESSWLEPDLIRL